MFFRMGSSLLAAFRLNQPLTFRTCGFLALSFFEGKAKQRGISLQMGPKLPFSHAGLKENIAWELRK